MTELVDITNHSVIRGAMSDAEIVTVDLAITT